MIKCLMLKEATNLIGELVEVDVELGEPDCRLVNPFQIDENNELRRWPSFTDQRTLMLQSDSILTIVDPNEGLLNQYKEIIS